MRIAKILMILTLSLAVFGYAEAQNINIDFGVGQSAITAPNTFGAASGQVGVWNNVDLGATSNLLDLSGNPTTASATVDAAVGTGYGGGCVGDLGALTNDNFYTTLPTWSVDLSGLTNGSYIVYLYGPSHDSVGTGNMVVNGVPVSSISGDGCSFVAGTNYTTVQVSVTSGSLLIAGTNIAQYAGLSGLQLIQQDAPAVPGTAGNPIFAPFPVICGVPGASSLCQTGTPQ